MVLLRGVALLEVLGAYPQQLRARPQRQKLAVVAIQKVLMQPLGMQSFYGEEDQPLGRQAQVWMKISFCCPSGEECWRLWERCAQRLLFSDKLGAEQIECGEAVWQKDWGGVVLPVKLCCKFLISGSTGEASQPMPEQVRVLPITDRAADVCSLQAQQLRREGFRVEVDSRNEKIGKKIREATLEKIPYMLVVGDRDMEAGTVSVRTRTGEDLGAMTVAGFTAMLHEVVDQKLK